MPYRTVSGARKSIPSLKNFSDSQVEDGESESSTIPRAIAVYKEVSKSLLEDGIEKATTKDVERDDKGNLVYRGDKFPAYNKPIKDSGNKQGKVLAKKGDQIKVVRFGDPSLSDNQSVEANNNFYSRFGGQDGMDDKFSALYWSARWLWPRGSKKGSGPKEFYKLNKSEDMTEINKATMFDKMRYLREAVDELEIYDYDEYGHKCACYCYLTDADDSYVYVRVKNGTFRYPYTMQDNVVEIDESSPQRVESETTYTLVSDPVEKSLDEDSIVNKLFNKILPHFGGSAQDKKVELENLPVVKQLDEEEMVAIEPLYVMPEEEDGHGETMTEIELRKMVDNMNKAIQEKRLKGNLFHKQMTDGFSAVKAWINECDCYIGETFVPEGQPIVKTKFHDKKLWELRKSGELKGVSIGARGKYREVEE